MNQISRRHSVSFAFLIPWICLSHADAQATPPSSVMPQKAFTNETSRDGHVYVEVMQGKGGRRETLVIKNGKGTYRVSDERLLGYNDDDSAYDHDFYLSPNAKWLFVTRKLFHTTDIGYLYHLKETQFVKVCPQGQRFDEAAIRSFSHRFHSPYTAVGDGVRIIRFEQWTADGKCLGFFFDLSRHYPSKKRYLIKGFYSLKSGQFGLVSLDTEDY